MKRNRTVFVLFVTLFLGGLFISFRSDPPPGRTGAPGESTCTSCHSSQNPNFDGTINITRLPQTIQPNTAYPISYTVNVTNGNPVRAGFQLTALDDSNSSVGIFTAGASTGTQTSGGRSYIEHRNAKSFSGGAVTYNFTWTSPAVISGNTVTLYTAALMGNGSGSGNDKTLLSNFPVTMMSSNPPSVNIVSSTDVSCFGGNDGSASAQGTGGTPPLIYVWSSGMAGPAVSGLSSGNYTVSVIDNLGLVATDQVVIGEPTQVHLSTINQTSIDCINVNGTATVSGSGGTGNYSYEWENGETGSIATNLPPGITNVSVTDGNNCTTVSMVNIMVDSLTPQADAGPNLQLNCNISQVQLQGSGSQGSNFTVNWSPSGGIISGANSFTPVIGTAGSYTLSVLDLMNGCSAISTVDVVQINNPTNSIGGLVEVSCSGNLDGSAVVTVTGGQAPFDYLWSNGETGQQAVMLPSGSGSVVVTDANGCTDSTSFIIGSPDPIFSNLATTPLTGVNSNDGAAVLSPSGGVSPYFYLWSTGDTTAMISGLSPGQYSVSITDINNCIFSESFVINDFDCSLTSSFSKSDVNCFGYSNGSATILGLNGTKPYSYLWSTGDTGSNVGNLPFGNYSVSLTDSTNCMIIESFTIDQPQEMFLSQVKKDVTCFGGTDGSIEILASGGIAPYNFTWSNGESGDSLSNLTAGNYTVVISDSVGCQLNRTINIGEPEDLSVILNIIDESGNNSNNGSISAVVLGGNGGNSYSWSNGETTSQISNLSPGDYTLTVMDSLGCSKFVSGIVNSFNCSGITVDVDTSNTYICPGSMSASLTLNQISGGLAPYSFTWSTGDTINQIDSLIAGDYILNVVDSNGCTFSQSFPVIEEDTVPPLVITRPFVLFLDSMGFVSFTPDDILDEVFDNCGTIDSVYLNKSSFNCNDIGFDTIQVVVFDSNGNSFESNESVQIKDSIPPKLICSDNIISMNCNGVDYIRPMVLDNCLGTNMIPQLLSGFESGSVFPEGITTVGYFVEDESGNIAVCDFTVEMRNSLDISVSAGTFNCDGTLNIDVATSGGTPPYLYNWFPGGNFPPFVVTDSFFVEVIDSLGCKVEYESVYSIPEPITITVDSILKSTDLENGAAFISAFGGSQPYTFEWVNSSGQLISTEEDLVNVLCDDYTLLITDVNGCTYLETIEVGCFTSTLNSRYSNFIKVFPNPANDQFSVSFDLPFPYISEVQILDLNGRPLVISKSEYLKNSTLNFNSGEWASGVYLVKILIENDVLVKRIIVN